MDEQLFADAINRVCARLDEKQKGEHKKDRQVEYRAMLESELISGMLLGEIPSKTYQRYLELVNHPFHGICAAVLKADILEQEGFSEAIWHELQRFCTCFGKLYKGNLILCFLPASDAEEKNYRKWMRDLFDCLKTALPEIDSGQLLVGISNLKQTPEAMPTGIKECQIALNGMDTSGVYFYEEEQQKKQKNYKKEFLECQEILEQRISAEFQRKICQIFLDEQDEAPSLDFLRVFAYWLMAGGRFREDIPFLYYERVWKNWGEILKLKNAGDLVRYLTEWERGRMDYSESLQKDNYYIQESLNYMVRHHAGNVSMEMVAAEINISSFYLSRLFKQVLKRTFLEVLTDIRFTRGIDLLYEGRENIQQISWKIGYANVSYFYRLFCRKMGMTAGEMKEYLQLL